MPGIIVKLGSFPNSQIRPRSAVRESVIINFALVMAVETPILVQNSQRIKAIIKNQGPNSVNIEYASGITPVFTLASGAALTVEGGGDNVFATAIGGPSELQIDDRLG